MPSELLDQSIKPTVLAEVSNRRLFEFSKLKYNQNDCFLSVALEVNLNDWYLINDCKYETNLIRVIEQDWY